MMAHAGELHQKTKIFWVIIFMTEWLLIAHTLYAQTRVQWLATPLSQSDPYFELALQGWSGPVILPSTGLNWEPHG